jgi:hypothetical protein
MKTLHTIINDCMDGFQPEPLDAYYAILALNWLLCREHEAHGQMAKATSEGKPMSSVQARQQIRASITRIKIAGSSEPKIVLGENNDPQTPEFQEKRRKAKADEALRKRVAQLSDLE